MGEIQAYCYGRYFSELLQKTYSRKQRYAPPHYNYVHGGEKILNIHAELEFYDCDEVERKGWLY